MDAIDLVISQTQVAMETLQDDVDGIDMIISQTQVDPVFSILENPSNGNHKPFPHSDDAPVGEINGDMSYREDVSRMETGLRDTTTQSPLVVATNNPEANSSPWIDAGNKSKDGEKTSTSIFGHADTDDVKSIQASPPPTYLSPSPTPSPSTSHPKRLFQSFAASTAKDTPPAPLAEKRHEKDRVFMSKLKRRYVGGVDADRSSEKGTNMEGGKKASCDFVFTSWAEDDEGALDEKGDGGMAVEEKKTSGGSNGKSKSKGASRDVYSDGEEEWRESHTRTHATEVDQNRNSEKKSKTPKSKANDSSDQATLCSNPYDIPDHLLSLQTLALRPWSVLWGKLEAVGWKWTKGKGLVDFFYLRPGIPVIGIGSSGCTYEKGLHYFCSTEDVELWVKTGWNKLRKNNSGHHEELEEDKLEPVKEKPAEEQGTSKRRLVKGASAKLSRAQASSTVSAVVEQKNDGDEDESPSESSSLINVRTAPWKQVWEVLRDYGWTWEFGRAHHNYFVPPAFALSAQGSGGNGGKEQAEALKFASEAEVRSFLKKEIREGRGELWPMFTLGSKNNTSVRADAKGVESDHSRVVNSVIEASQVELPPSVWELSKHRSKRAYTQAVTISLQHQQAEGPVEGIAMREELTQKQQTHQSPAKIRKTSHPHPQTHGSKNNASDLLLTSHVPSALSVPAPTPRKPSHGNVNISLLHQVQRGLEGAEGGGAGAGRSSTRVLHGCMCIFSGLESKIKGEVEKAVELLGGAVVTLDSLREIQDLILNKEKEKGGKGVGDTGHKVFLLSQPQDFRKPKYMLASLLGIPLLHYKWVLAILEEGLVPPTSSYSLPLTYSALHSHYVFRAPTEGGGDRGNGILEGVRVVNLTGNRNWDDLLSTAGATVRTSDEDFLATLSSLEVGGHVGVEADLILFDSAVYARSSLMLSNAAFSSKRSPKKDKKPSLSKLALDVIEHCHNVYIKTIALSRNKDIAVWPPLVASTEWLTYCLSANTFSSIRAIDIFSLPKDVEHHPIVFKSDLEVGAGDSLTTLGSGGGGERFCVHDFVCYAQGGGRESEKVSVGKIVGFLRRNVESPLLVRVQEVGVNNVSMDPRNASSSASKKQSAKLVGRQIVPLPLAERVIPARQLLKKMVVYKQADYLSRSAYTVHDSDIMFISDAHLQELWPEVKGVHGEEEGENGVDDDTGMVYASQDL